jgi:hypothetical protein
LRDIAESDLPDAGAEAGRLPKEPKPPFDGDGRDGEDGDGADERCDEKPLLKDAREGLASAGTEATDRARLSASAADAYVGSVFSMVRKAVES